MDRKPSKKPFAAAFRMPKQLPVNSHTVYINNLSYELDKEGLRNIFSQFGEVKYIKIVVDLKTLKSKGMAFVEMGSVKQAKDAISALHQQIIDGRTVKVTTATPMRAHKRELAQSKKAVPVASAAPGKKLTSRF